MFPLLRNNKLGRSVRVRGSAVWTLVTRYLPQHKPHFQVLNCIPNPNYNRETTPSLNNIKGKIFYFEPGYRRTLNFPTNFDGCP